MTLIVTNKSDSFNQWRVNTNQLGVNVGDISNLDTTNKTSVVTAMNEVYSDVNDLTTELGTFKTDVENVVQIGANIVMLAMVLG